MVSQPRRNPGLSAIRGLFTLCQQCIDVRITRVYCRGMDKEHRTKPFQIRLTAAEHALWAEAAKAEGRSLSNFVRIHCTARAVLATKGGKPIADIAR